MNDEVNEQPNPVEPEVVQGYGNEYSDYVNGIPTLKRCTKCFEEKPLNPTCWPGIRPSHRHSYKPGTLFGPECRKCVRAAKVESRMAGREKKEAEAEARHLYWLARLKGKQLSAVRSAVLGGRVGIAHIAEIFEALMSMFGGSVGYAEALMSDYVSANPGSMQRIQLHKVMQLYASKVSDSGAAKKPVDLMTNEELEAAAKEHEKMRLRVMIDNGNFHEVIDTAPPPSMEVRHAANG